MAEETGKGTQGRVCVDTSVLISLLKNRRAAEQLILQNAQLKVFISSVTAFELLLRETKLDEIEPFVNTLTQLPFGEKEARTASAISKSLRKKGTPISLPDLFIGATAIVNNCELATLNKKDFEKIDGLKLLEI